MDLAVGAAFILAASARRWALEVAFFAIKQHLGSADPQNQAASAVRPTAPFAGLVHALVVLRAAERVRAGQAPAWSAHPWYRRKTAPAFQDLLAALRRAGVQRRPPAPSAPPCRTRRRQNPRPARLTTTHATARWVG